MGYCARCGKELPVNARFCPSCGLAITAEERATALSRNSEDDPAQAREIDSSSSAPGQSDPESTMSAAGSEGRRKLPPAVLIALAIALLCMIVLAAYYVNAGGNHPGKEEQVEKPEVTAPTEKEVEPEGVAASSRTSEELAQGLAGWWVPQNEDLYAFYYLDGDVFYLFRYQAETDDGTGVIGDVFAQIESMEDLSEAKVESESPGYRINTSKPIAFYSYDDQPELLEWHEDSSVIEESGLRHAAEDEIPDNVLRAFNYMMGIETPPSPEPEPESNADYHVETALFAFDIPEHWRGRVDVAEESDGVVVNMKGTDLYLVRLHTEDPQTAQQGGDIGAANFGAWDMASGQAAVLRAMTPGALVSIGMGVPMFDGYTDTQLEEYANLMTKGRTTAAELYGHNGLEAANEGQAEVINELKATVQIKG